LVRMWTKVSSGGKREKKLIVQTIVVTDVVHVLPGSQPMFKPMEFLWVRWFRYDARWKAGLKHHRLHRVHFVSDTDSDAYGFLDPDKVICGVHLIPAYTHGQVDGKWRFLYVNS